MSDRLSESDIINIQNFLISECLLEEWENDWILWIKTREAIKSYFQNQESKFPNPDWDNNNHNYKSWDENKKCNFNSLQENWDWDYSCDDGSTKINIWKWDISNSQKLRMWETTIKD